MEEYKIKIVVMGYREVGKTTWINRLSTGNFDNDYVPTIHLNPKELLHFRCTDGTRISFSLWDCANSEFYSYSLLQTISHATILFCDATRPETFNCIRRSFYRGPVVVCANKSDLVHTHNIEEGERDGIYYLKVSVASGDAIRKPLLLIARKLLENDELEFELP